MLQSFRHNHGDQHGIGNRQLAQVIDPVLHALAIHQLHGHEVQTLLLEHAVALHNVRVIDLGHRAGFAHKAIKEPWLLGQFLHHHFERAGTIQTDLLSEIDGAHPSLAELLGDLEVAEDLFLGLFPILGLGIAFGFGCGFLRVGCTAHDLSPFHAAGCLRSGDDGFAEVGGNDCSGITVSRSHKSVPHGIHRYGHMRDRLCIRLKPFARQKFPNSCVIKKFAASEVRRFSTNLQTSD